MSTNDLGHISARVGLNEKYKTKAKINDRIKVALPSTRDYHLIVLVSSLSFGIVVALFTVVQPMMILHYESPSMVDVSKCAQIVDFERIGHYTSQAQFRVAESYCVN